MPGRDQADIDNDDESAVPEQSTSLLAGFDTARSEPAPAHGSYRVVSPFAETDDT